LGFVKQAFGATELMRVKGSSGGIHAEVRIGTSIATSIMEPTNRPDGDRLAGVKDQFGNIWYLATYQTDVLVE